MDGLELLVDLEKMKLVLFGVIRNADNFCVVLLNELADAKLVNRLFVDKVENSDWCGRLRNRVELHLSVNRENR